MEELTYKDIRQELSRKTKRIYNYRFRDMLSNFVKSNEALFKKYKQQAIFKKIDDDKLRSNQNYVDRAYAVILNHQDVFKAFIDQTNSTEIYHRLAHYRYTTFNNISEFLEDKDDDDIFPKRSDNWRGSAYGLPLLIRRQLLHFLDLYPKPIEGLKEIPETVSIFEGENVIFNELPMLLAYVKQHGLEQLKTTPKVKTSEINKLKKSLNGVEFFPKDKRLQGNLRHHFLGNLITNIPYPFFQNSTVSILKHIFRDIYRNETFKSSFIIFSHIKGLDKYYYDVKENWENRIFRSIKQIKPNLWYECDNWFRNVQLEENISVFTLSTAKDKIYEDWFYSYRSKPVNHRINGIHERFVEKPFLNGTLFLFAAFGLIDLAYDDAVTKEEFAGDVIDPYRSLKYFKLNNLGAFVLGLTNEYKPPKVVSNDELFLSKDALVITTHEDNKKAKMLLKEYAVEVGENRYATDFEKFTDKCHSILQVKEKIDDFKNIVGKVPQIWDNFFNEIINNAYPIDELDKYKIFKIKNNPELIRTIARDETLKKWIIKAEQFHIIVLERDVYKVKKRLRQLGYFIA